MLTTATKCEVKIQDLYYRISDRESTITDTMSLMVYHSLFVVGVTTNH